MMISSKSDITWIILVIIWTILLSCGVSTHAFTSIATTSLHHNPIKSKSLFVLNNHKQTFLDALDYENKLNIASKERSALMQKMIDEKVSVPLSKWEVEQQELKSNEQQRPCLSLENPGLLETFNHVAEGCWKVIYAPHMITIAGLFSGKFDVQYILYSSGNIESHAEYEFPIVGRGFLSVSGTYSSVDNNVSRVDFDKAWIKPLSLSDNIEPYATFDDVPEGIIKQIINTIGRALFIEQFSVFPISFLDENLIVFDFPLLGTRICALKQ